MSVFILTDLLHGHFTKIHVHGEIRNEKERIGKNGKKAVVNLQCNV